jgi:hypothetical protein
MNSLIKKFRNLIFGSEPIKVISDASFESAVSRLSNKLTKPRTITLSAKAIYGSIGSSGSEVNLGIPRDRDIFPLEFVGKFSLEHEKVVLTGIIQFPKFVRGFICVWFSGVAIVTLLATFSLLNGGILDLYKPFLPGAMFVGAFLTLGKVKYSSIQEYKSWMHRDILDIINGTP